MACGVWCVALSVRYVHRPSPPIPSGNVLILESTWITSFLASLHNPYTIVTNSRPAKKCRPQSFAASMLPRFRDSGITPPSLLPLLSLHLMTRTLLQGLVPIPMPMPIGHPEMEVEWLHPPKTKDERWRPSVGRAKGLEREGECSKRVQDD